jgi:hypothetical protein
MRKKVKKIGRSRKGGLEEGEGERAPPNLPSRSRHFVGLKPPTSVNSMKPPLSPPTSFDYGEEDKEEEEREKE